MARNPGKSIVRSRQKHRVGEGSVFSGPGGVARFLGLIKRASITKKFFSVRNPRRK